MLKSFFGFAQCLIAGLLSRHRARRAEWAREKAQAAFDRQPLDVAKISRKEKMAAAAAWITFIFGPLLIGLFLACLALNPHIHWLPQGLSDAAQSVSWGGLPENPPASMRVVRCENGVFAEGAPNCKGPAVNVGPASGWRERAQRAQRGVFSVSDSPQTRVDLLATKKREKNTAWTVIFVIVMAGSGPVVFGFFVGPVVCGAMIVQEKKKTGSWPSGKSSSWAPIGFAGFCFIAVALGWIAQARLDLEMKPYSQQIQSAPNEGPLLGLNRKTPQTLFLQKTAPWELVWGDDSGYLSHEQATEGANQNTTPLGKWSWDDLDGVQPADLLAKKAPNLNAADRARAAWILTQAHETHSVWLSRLLQGIFLEAGIMALGVCAVLAAQAFRKAKSGAKRAAARIQAIAQEGEGVTRAKRERTSLSAEIGLASNSAEDVANIQGPPKPSLRGRVSRL